MTMQWSGMSNAVVVAKVVVRGDTLCFDISAHHELNQSGLRLSLPRFEAQWTRCASRRDRLCQERECFAESR